MPRVVKGSGTLTVDLEARYRLHSSSHSALRRRLFLFPALLFLGLSATVRPELYALPLRWIPASHQTPHLGSSDGTAQIFGPLLPAPLRGIPPVIISGVMGGRTVGEINEIVGLIQGEHTPRTLNPPHQLHVMTYKEAPATGISLPVLPEDPSLPGMGLMDTPGLDRRKNFEQPLFLLLGEGVFPAPPQGN